MKYVIFDLDGCLADDRHRKPLIDDQAPDPWAAYHAECDKDPLINGHLLNQHCHQIIFTTRPENYREKTIQWLRTVAKINPPRVFMRPNGCTKRSPELKREFLSSLLKDGFELTDIVCAFDDREDVLSVYKAFGIPTQKVTYPSKENLDEQKSPVENLSTGADTFRKRNAVYGGSYLTFGAVASALFPDGLKIVPQDVNAFNRLGVFVQIISKCCRYAAKFNSGGHADSAHDLMVYAAILESLTKEISNEKF